MTTKLKITSLFILENMHKEILTKEQIKLLPLVGLFKRNFWISRRDSYCFANRAQAIG